MFEEQEYVENYAERSREERLERIVDELVESAEVNAWEYGNTGNFLYN